jgi:23S rRNA (uracil1939-C5)-methyltransferase
LTDKLVEAVCDLTLTGQLNKVTDVYCGCGLFSVSLAAYAGEILGIELNLKSVKFARLNAEKENLKNVKFICGDTAEGLFKCKTLSGALDLLILDPPRFGCEKSVLKAIADLLPARIIYVSYNPATQARDIRFFKQSGHRLWSLLPLDMFSQTQHVEVIALLEHE